jgi:outer membrane protein
MFKKVLLVSLSLFSLNTFAGLDVELELRHWVSQDNSVLSQDLDGDRNFFGSLSVENPIPLIPNVRYSYNGFETEQFEYTREDITFFYEIFDNDIIEVDLGFGLSRFSNGVYTPSGLGSEVDFEGYVPFVFGKQEFEIPMTDVKFFTDLMYTNINDSVYHDLTVGIGYEFEFVVVDVEFQAGYRTIEFELQDFDGISDEFSTDGFFLGLTVDF